MDLPADHEHFVADPPPGVPADEHTELGDPGWPAQSTSRLLRTDIRRASWRRKHALMFLQQLRARAPLLRERGRRTANNERLEFRVIVALDQQKLYSSIRTWPSSTTRMRYGLPAAFRGGRPPYRLSDFAPWARANAWGRARSDSILSDTFEAPHRRDLPDRRIEEARRVVLERLRFLLVDAPRAAITDWKHPSWSTHSLRVWAKSLMRWRARPRSSACVYRPCLRRRAPDAVGSAGLAEEARENAGRAGRDESAVPGRRIDPRGVRPNSLKRRTKTNYIA